jgi:hypothetical protein
MSGEMMTSLFASFAQAESQSISGNMRLGNQMRMKAGTFLPSSVAYGYRLNDRRLEIEPAEALIVCEIFQDYLSGKSRTLIAEDLNKRNIPTRSGKIWFETAVAYILKNERYIGDSVWQKTYATDTLPARQVKNMGERQKYYAEKTHPPIIDREAFEQVQELGQRRKMKFGHMRTHQAEAFRQKIVCAKCGAIWRKKVVRSITYWACQTHDSAPTKCEITQILESEIQSAFLRLYGNLKNHSDEVFTPMIRSLQAIRNRRMLWSVDIVDLNKQIADLSSQNQMLAQLKKQGLIDPDIFIAQTNELTEQIRSAKLKKERLLEADGDHTIAQTLELLEILENGPDVLDTFDDGLFDDLIEKIIVDSNKQLRFHLKNGLELTESIERTVR